MTSSPRLLVAATLTLIAVACSSAPLPSTADSYRVLGREDDVRIDAKLFTGAVGPNALIRVDYEIENFRNAPIAIANLSGDASYDVDSRTITVSVGSEIPTDQSVTKLVTIPAGTRKSLSTGARVNVALPLLGPQTPRPRYLRLRVNYLGNAEPFDALLPPSPAAKVDADVFPVWIENNQAVMTSAVPIVWGNAGPGALADASVRAGLR
ncbi:MAG: hypothetical protein ACYC7A_17085 [Thermoanaerobaculia bacterium]